MSIHDVIEKIKAFIKGEGARDAITMAIIGLVGIGSFFLGRWSNMDKPSAYAIEQTSQPNPALEVKSELNELKETTVENKVEQTVSGSFFASKNGTKYYPKGCSGINKIKAENLIGFATEAEAKASGRTKSSVCK